MRPFLFLLLGILPVACSSEQPPTRQDAEQKPASINSATAPDEDLATPTETMVDEKAPAPKVDFLSSFQGRWAGMQDVCGDSRAVLELTVAPDKLIFHESVGTVQSVTPRSDGTIAVEAAFTGEGQSWTRTLVLRGSGDGQLLTIVHDGVAITRKRC